MQPDQAPIEQPTAAPLPPQPVAPARASSGTIVLQWLTYAFWGWTLLALSALTTLVVASFITSEDGSGFTPFGIAAVVVLLPLSFVCDLLYSRRESQHKSGAEMVVMVIHAVIFALFGVGSLILAVISMVQMLTDASYASTKQTGLISALIIAFFYGMTLLRTLNPASIPIVRQAYRIFMLATVGVVIMLTITGPLAVERTRRDDKAVEAEISTIHNAIEDYVADNNTLPTGLDKLSLSAEAQSVVDKGLVTYKKVASEKTTSVSKTSTLTTTHKYELCGNYKVESRGYSSGNRYSENRDYQTYVSTYSHPAGLVCYRLKVIDRDNL